MGEMVYVDRYNRHCLDKLIGTTTEDRLVSEGHQFTLSDGTPYITDVRGSMSTMLIKEGAAERAPDETEEERRVREEEKSRRLRAPEVPRPKAPVETERPRQTSAPAPQPKP